jgi:hypothetical protein
MLIMYTLELYAIIFASFTYLIWNHSSCVRVTPSSTSIKDSAPPDPPSNPRLQESRVPRRGTTPISSPVSENRGYVWMTVPKNYRSKFVAISTTLTDIFRLGRRPMMVLAAASSLVR